jgi:hypothetical protein
MSEGGSLCGFWRFRPFSNVCSYFSANWKLTSSLESLYRFRPDVLRIFVRRFLCAE